MILSSAAWVAVAITGSAYGGVAAPIHNPALLNIGLVCRWNERCIKRQERAMTSALRFVRSRRPPAWKIQACNRNASRGRNRVDWIGFGNCIRNSKLGRPVRRTTRR